MCGIFGVINDGTSENVDSVKQIFVSLMKSSETRGKDASGFMIATTGKLLTIKSKMRGKYLLRNRYFKSVLNDSLKNAGQSFMLGGHTRMVTHGDPRNMDNNQPCFIGDEFVLFHNGVITNWLDLATEIGLVHPTFFSDTQVLAAFIESKNFESKNTKFVLQNILEKVEGANNFVILDRKTGNVFFYTSNGSLFAGWDKSTNTFIYASERNIINKIIRKSQTHLIKQIPKNIVLDIEEVGIFTSKNCLQFDLQDLPELENVNLNSHSHESSLVNFSLGTDTLDEINILLSSIDREKIADIKRCKRCILPVTFPGIIFDEKGVCSICLSFSRIEEHGKFALEKTLLDFGGKVLIPISGGRDSCYALHYVVKELGFEAIAYTYDWGFVSNSARENISKVCGELGVEHVLVAADISRKRLNVRKNLLAWLRKPSIGMIPLLMAGDKQFLTIGERIRKENDLGVSIFAMNKFEKTYFKSVYAGASFSVDSKRIHGISFFDKLRLLRFYFIKFISNYQYLNSSLFDSIVGYFSFYFVKSNYIQIFDYIEWDEFKIMKVLTEEYNWKAEGESASWRSGDATSSFYNYLYLKYGGFTENDTFRSNQIRYGVITRSDALAKIEKENEVQSQGIISYLNSLGVELRPVNQALKSWGQFSA
jgi:glucosamine--fructose-6-phosphate aminotransferase (isomerizing)